MLRILAACVIVTSLLVMEDFVFKAVSSRNLHDLIVEDLELFVLSLVDLQFCLQLD